LHQQVVTLTRISDVVLEDGGSLQFTAPFAFDEQDKVCIQTYDASVGIDRYVNMEVSYNG